MSGFGGSGSAGTSGFRSSKPNINMINNPFGVSDIGSSSQTTDAPVDFGKSSETTSGTFGGGFGFGSNVSDNMNRPLGPSPAIAQFDGSTNTSLFQNSNAAGGMTFGSSPNVVVAPSNGRSGFGGESEPLRSGAGTTLGSQPHSRQQNKNSSASSPFGASFVGSQSHSHDSSTPFGGSTSQPQQSQFAFGLSSNLLVNNAPNKTNQNFGGGGINDTGSSFGGSDGDIGRINFGSSTVSVENSKRSDFDQTLSFNSKTNSSSNKIGPYGGGAMTSVVAPFGDGAASTNSALSTVATISEYNNDDKNMGEDSDNNKNKQKNIDSAKAEMEEKKRILKAKIEAKKRQLLQRQQQKKRQSEAGSRSKSPTLMSASAKSPHELNQRDPQPNSQTSQQSLAERNTLRFAQHRNNLSTRAQAPVTTTTTTGSKEREDLKHAVNLVGLCPTMCPSDELERRCNESDIQALEVPLPGQLHPSDWTLKDTCIKRFRRSAADFKLDVQDWVRPPEVLERTLGYLEEWIMERDRQGPDPRFPQKDVPPPPLDVYQFIWDRTRMIRKDFILQNYVGTGGRCDAKAVRCHERIARWHAMCEHQLSHIDDFVNMQSQQNMQELGQTMKTLNSFYDDALNRSTKEVPDERTGMEKFLPKTNHTTNTSSDINKSTRGGCIFDTVQGQNPIDYNGHPLNNAKDNPMITQRFIGDNINKTMSRGTAEPEMRGIYMLLTMENEGGMEVLKYAAKLFKERPAIYQSPPVQIALTIFKAIKDMNYVKFFSILRSQSTPYLFSCIMFKQVEAMRRIAMQIMSISYGARNKNTGDAMYDQYPLERLMYVLCFEDIEEAKQTCEFYNVTVREYTSQRSGEIKEAILWKGSRFRVPKDTEKGHTLRLKPRKMIRTIESKLNGATRLAVCRGELSGKRAALFDPAKPSALNPKHIPASPKSKNLMDAKASIVTDSEALAQNLIMKKRLEEAMRKELAQNQKEKEIRDMKKHQREEQRKKEIKEQELAEFEKRRKELRQIEIQQQRIEEERSKRRKEEELIRKRKADKARKDAQEAARKQKQLEEQRKREEREERRLELERRIALEIHRKELKEEEERRCEVLRLQLEAKRRLQVEEKRNANDWQRKVDAATKALMWYRWERTLSRPLEFSARSKNSLREIDPSYKTDSFNLVKVAQTTTPHNIQKLQAPITQQATSRVIIEELQEKFVNAPKLAVADMTLEEIKSLSNHSAGHVGSRKSINLLKIALVCPETMDVTDQSYASLLYRWIGTRVNLGEIEISKSGNSSHFCSRHEVRTLIVIGSCYEVCSTCDVALFVIPPKWTDPEEKATLLHGFASSLLDEDIPRVALVLNDCIEEDQIQNTNNVIAKELGGNMEAIPIIRPSKLSTEAFDSALTIAFRRVARLFILEGCMSVIRIPAMQIATNVVRSVLWQSIPSAVGRDVDEDTIVECSRLSLQLLVDELVTYSRLNKSEWSLWPAPEFSSKEAIVASYFAENEGLPLQWERHLGQNFLQETYQPLLAVFRGHFRDAYQRIVVDAPITIQVDCASDCAHGQYRRCLEKALLWMQEDSASSGCFLYLPESMLEMVVNNIISKVKASLFARPTNFAKGIPILAAEYSTFDNMVFLKTIECNETSKGRLDKKHDSFDAVIPATAFVNNGPLLPNTKRSRSATELEHASKKKRLGRGDITHIVTSTAITREKNGNSNVDIPAATSDFSRSNNMQGKKTTCTGKAYAKKLERLLRGDETIELTVGNTLLSRYLRDVPEPQI